MSQFFASGDQSIGASASASVLPMNNQNLFHLELTSLISLLSKVFSRVFSSTTIQKHQFFKAQPSLWSNSHIHTWLPEKTWFWLYGPLSAKWCFCFLICGLGLSYFFFQGASVILWLQSLSTVILEPKKIKPVTVSTFSPAVCREVMGPDAMILVFWMLSFKPALSLFLLPQDVL